MEFRKDINGLRAWAVIAVVLFHFGVPGFSGGFVGVDVFFVISGFLMTSIIVGGMERNSFSILGFYYARAKRIVPALLVVCAALLVLGWFLLTPPDYRALGAHAGTASTFVSNILFFLRESTYFDASAHARWLLHTWSLSVEWQFYMLHPLLLLAAVKLGKSQVFLRRAVWFIAIGSLLCSIVQAQTSPMAGFYLLLSRAWELLAGSLVYLHRSQIDLTERQSRYIQVFGFFLIMASVLAFDGGFKWPGFWAVFPVTGSALVMLASRKNPWLFDNPLAQQLGVSSYSLYLWHWPITVGLAYFGLSGSWPAVCAGIVATLLAGFLSYRVIEQPSRRLLAMAPVRAGTVGLAGAVVAVCAVGGVLATKDGVPSRVPAAVMAVLAEESNVNFATQGCEACSFGPEPVAVAVWGDSHATAMLSAVTASLGKAGGGVRLHVMGGCPTLFGASIPRFDYRTECDAFNERTLGRINELPGSVPVIIVNRMSVYVEGFNESIGGLPPYAEFQGHHPVTADERRAVFAEQMVSSLCRIARDRTVYVVKPVPEMSVNVPRVLARKLMVADNHADVSVALDEYRERHAAVLRGLRDAGNACGVRTLDPVPYLCSSGVCGGTRDGRPLYRDDNHLNEFGNRLLIPMFQHVFHGR